MSDRFADVPRGQALRGSRAIAEYLLDDAEASEIVCSLPRDEFGFVMLGRDLTGFTGWIDFAVAERARNGKARGRTAATSVEPATS